MPDFDLDTQLKQAAGTAHGRVTMPPAAEIRRLGQRRAQRRHAALAGATALIIALFGAVALNLAGFNRTDNTPASTPTPTPTVESGVKVTGTLDPAKLPQGKAPAVVWTDGEGVLHDGDRTVRLPEGRVEQIARTSDGYAVLTRLPGEDQFLTQLWLVDPSGRATELDRGGMYAFALSADRTRVAWAYTETAAVSANPPATLKLADTSSGRVVYDLQADESYYAVGFAGDQVLLKRTGAGDTDPAWAPATATLAPYRQGFKIGMVDSEAGLVSLWRPGRNDGENCYALVRSSQPETTLWETCEIGPVALSPDGEWVAAFPGYYDGFGPTRLYAASVSDGRVMSWVDGDAFGDVVWEDDSHFLTVAHTTSQGAVVRCSIDFYCERATGLLAGGPATDAMAPFRLGR